MFGCAASARRWQYDILLRVAGSNPAVRTSTRRRRETYLSERDTLCVSHLSLAREFHAMMITTVYRGFDETILRQDQWGFIRHSYSEHEILKHYFNNWYWEIRECCLTFFILYYIIMYYNSYRMYQMHWLNCYFPVLCSDYCPKRKNNSFAYSIFLIEKLIVSRNSNLNWGRKLRKALEEATNEERQERSARCRQRAIRRNQHVN